MRIKFSRMNWESECLYDCIYGNGFLISEEPFSDIDKSIRNMNGPRSPRYGSEMNDSSANNPNIFQERYSCKCGNLVGSQFEGEVCPICGEKIEYREADPMITGWLNFSPYHLLNPGSNCKGL